MMTRQSLRIAAIAIPTLLGTFSAGIADETDKGFAYGNRVYADRVDWTGIYTGLHSGGVQGKTFFHTVGPQSPESVIGYTWPGTYRTAEISVERVAKITGWHVGPHIGYQVQRGNFVFGGDVGFSIGGGQGKVDCTGNIRAVSGDNTIGVSCESEYKYSFNARARLGYAWDNTLLYVTGGYVRAKIENRVNYSSAINPDVPTFNEFGTASPNGYLLGAGLEYQTASGWRLGLSYTHIVLEEVDFVMKNTYGVTRTYETLPDPNILGATLKIPLQQQAPAIADPGPPAAQTPAVAQAQVPVTPAVAPAARPAPAPAAAPASSAPRAAPPPAAAKPVPGTPIEPDAPVIKGKSSK